MTEQEKREKVINGLEQFIADFKPFCGNEADWKQVFDALALLKEHEKATIEPKRIDLTDETKAWLDKMDAVDALGNIADICMDWDGYRTANGLGGLINEIWAYARYCADRLLKAQEPMVMTLEEAKSVEGYVWLEYRDRDVLSVSFFRGGFYIEPFERPLRADLMNWADYNKGWRYWTSVPTDEQREAIPWK